MTKTDEDKEILHRISQLAGQINRHKSNQASLQSGSHRPSVYNRNHAHRYAGVPYPPRGRGRAAYRGATTHHHRTLNLVSTHTTSPASGSASADDQSGWVSRTDRHRQLINANVFEKDSQARQKAIEETQRRKLQAKHSQEKRQFSAFVTHQNSVPANNGNRATVPEIVVDGIRFRVLEGGKKLVKLQDDHNAGSETPRSTVVAGVKFYRTKTGNLVANRVIQSQRRSGKVKKVDERCKIFSSTGSCPKGPSCRYIHDPHRVAVCKDYLKHGACPRGESCDLSHDLSPERMPDCVHFARGNCNKANCAYTHSQSSPAAPVCRAFGFYGYCDNGAKCSDRHVVECPDFSNTGRCSDRMCKLPHRERASVLLSRARAEHEEVDVSSDEEPANSDDVDSDEVAEFIDADSDSDTEMTKDFLPIG